MAKGVVWKNWNTKKFIEKIAEEVQENMDLACAYAAEDAKQRLLRISEPKWGERYRFKVVARLIASETSRKGKTIIGRIGVAKGTRGTKGAHNIGLWIETGSRTAPAHPFLRPAVFQNAKEIVDIISGKFEPLAGTSITGNVAHLAGYENPRTGDPGDDENFENPDA